MSIELGLDPETLDIDSFAFEDEDMNRQNTLNTHCRKLQVVERKLRELP